MKNQIETLKRAKRIDFTKVGAQVDVSYWIGQAQEPGRLRLQASIFEILSQLEPHGYSVKMSMDGTTGRALKAETTRIDFIKVGDAWRVKRYPEGWMATTPPMKIEDKPADFDLEAALDWLKQQGWTVLTWDGGARAWKGDAKPVRNKGEILRLRQRMETPLDLAFYY